MRVGMQRVHPAQREPSSEHRSLTKAALQCLVSTRRNRARCFGGELCLFFELLFPLHEVLRGNAHDNMAPAITP